MRCASLLLAVFVAWTGPVAAQSFEDAPNRFAAAAMPVPAIVAPRPPPLQRPDTLAPPNYSHMTMAGGTTAALSLFLAWLLMEQFPNLGYEHYTFLGPIPGTVLVPMAIHSVNGSRGSLEASMLTSAIIWAGYVALLRAQPVLPSMLQVPMAVLIEGATTGERGSP